jgi:hypothetical protein
MKVKVIFICFISFLLFQSCENEVDLLAPWEERMVVYGLLSPPDATASPTDTVWQYFRISRVFSNKGGAYINAGKDSGIYSNPLDVKLERFSGKTLVETINLYPIISKAKEPGIFPNDKQILYVTYKPIKNVSEYRLSVSNPQTGIGVNAKTVTIGQFEVSSSFLNEPNVNWYSSLKVRPSWKSCKNGKIYQVSVRFHYSEKSSNSTVYVKKYFDWNLSPVYSNGTGGGENMNTEVLTPSDFNSQLLSNVKVEAGVERLAGQIEFVFTAGNQEFSDYMDINRPSDGVVQDKPIYTNINGGIGLFASRISHSMFKSLAGQSIDSLINGSQTSSLGFK